MNIKITHSWLLEHLDTDATPEEVQKYLSLCGPSVERVEKVGSETVYDIEITSNRIDTASVIGIAREAAAILPMFKKKSIKNEMQVDSGAFSGTQVEIDIIDPEKVCRRVLGVVLEVPNGVQNSPTYVAERLTACDIRSLNNLVDITNYVMVETGHPTHVFDYDRITSHKLILRHAKKNEKIVTLDEKEYALDTTDIIIDDGNGTVIDLPGIMGTANSVVTRDTKRILFFIESNDPVSIRKTSMRYGIRTMASTINEKNPDSELALTALLRGIHLYKEIAGARQISHIIDLYPKKPSKTTIVTNKGFIDGKIGISIPLKTIVSLLTDLSFNVTVHEAEELHIEVPTHRLADVSIPEDIVEEVARIYGYFAIPSVLQVPAYVAQPHSTELLFMYQYAVKTFLKHLGYTEVMNYSATSLELLQKFNQNPEEHLFITNSISEDIKYLRKSLMPSLVQNVKQNSGFTQHMNLFELAKVYEPAANGLPSEQFMLSFVTNTSLESLKQVVHSLLGDLNIPFSVTQTATSPYFLPAVEGTISNGSVKFGIFGQVKPNYCRNLSIDGSVYAAELHFESIMQAARLMPEYHPYSQYPHILLDITVQKSISFAEIEVRAKKASKHLYSLTIKDVYKDTITLHCMFTDANRQLTEKEALEELEAIKKSITG